MRSSERLEMTERAAGMMADGRYDVAARILLDEGLRAFPPAMNYLGLLHQLGLGVERSLSTARRLFEDAMAQGYGPAAHNLGSMLMSLATEETSEAVRRDLHRQAKACYRQAAALGFVVADPGWYEE